jgi:regulator of replication initiation timing
MKYSLLLAALLYASSLIAQVSQAPQTIGSFDKLDSLETQVTQIDSEMGSLKGQVSSVENQVASVETKLSSVENQVAGVDKKMSSVENKLTSVNSNMTVMKKMNDIVAPETETVLSKVSNLRINVIGQGVAPMNTVSPAQAYALAKRAATADAYRLIAEKVMGVRIEGQDTIKDMMVKRSTVNTAVKAMVRNADIIETTFKEGLCEVEMEVVLSGSQF